MRGIQRISKPRSAASICHGTMFAWCSRCVSRIASPAPRFVRPQLCATRLIDSVALRVNTISPSEAAPMKLRTLPRASSMRRVASSAMV